LRNITAGATKTKIFFDWVIGGANGAAARLGMKRTTLQYRIQKLGIERGGS